MQQIAKHFFKIITIAILYYLLGKIGIYFKIASETIPAIWPAAGLALSCMLICGPKYAPGIFIGTYVIALEFLNIIAPSTPSVTLHIVSACIAASAVIEAITGAFLVTKVLQNTVSRERDLVLTIILAGAISACLGAIIATTGLWKFNIIDSKNYFTTWLGWALGDTIGIALLSPIIIMFNRTFIPHLELKTKYLIVAIVIAIQSITALFIFKEKEHKQELIQQKFSKEVNTLFFHITKELENIHDDLIDIQAFFKSSKNVDRAEFKTFTQPTLQKDKAIKTIQWAAKVTQNQRTDLEQTIQQQGIKHFSITQHKKGIFIPEKQKQYYYPILYIEPEEPNKHLLGFNLASEKKRLNTIEKTINTRSAQATPPIHLIQDNKTQLGMEVFLPLYKNNVLQGLISGTYEYKAIVSKALDGLNSNNAIAIHMSDITLTPHSQEQQESQNHIALLKNFLGRTYKYTFSLNDSVFFKTNENQWTGWIILITGTFFAITILIILLLKTTQNYTIQQTVTRRTKELKAANEQLQLILNNSGEGIFGLNNNGETTFANPAALKLTGYSEKEMIGKKQHTLILHHYQNGKKYPEKQCKIYSAYTKGKVVSADNEVFWHKNGTNFPVEYIASPIHGEKNTTEGAVVVFKDISQRKASEEALKNSEERFFLAVKGSSDGIWDWDLETNHVYFSPRFKELMGYEDNEIENQFDEWKKRLHPKDRDITLNEVEKHFKERKPYNVIYRLKTKSNTYRWFRARGQALWDKKGKPFRMAGSLSDITDLIEAQQKAEEATKIKSAFLANMSHEIRTPLNGAMGMTQLLLNTPLTEEQKKIAIDIFNAENTLLEIINNILDFSKIEAGGLIIENQEIQLSSILNNALNIIKPKAQEKKLTLKSHIDKKLSKSFIGDELRIKQILTNLLSNAVKFTEKGSITANITSVKNTKTTTRLRFEVTDTGIGISQKEQENIFKHFSQADTSTSRKFGGTGLGLAICKELVELMKGKIGVDSVKDTGSTFWFEITLKHAKHSTKE